MAHVDTVCLVQADPRNMFTRVPPPPDVQTRAFQPSAAAITVTYTDFTPQAQAAFQYAVDIWQSQLTSTVPIRVNAEFTVLSGSTLGSAGATLVFRDFAGATVPATWYAKALANKLYGSELDATTVDISARFNSNFTWYYGTDGLTPGGQYDFVSVVLHELAHGLGYFGSMYVDSTLGLGWGWGGVYPHIYDRFVENASAQAVLNTALFPNYSSALAAELTGNALYWNGANGLAANGGVRPRIYAPDTWRQGSSYSHVDEATYPPGDPNSLMTYAIGAAEAIHDPGPITRGMFADEGWTVSACAFGISPSSASYSAVGGSGTIAVTTGTGCAWTATSGASWITVTSGGSGAGSGTVGYSVAANPATASRAGTLTVAGRTFTITQAGASCTYTILPTSAVLGAGRGSGSVAVSTPAGCAWTAETNAPSWLTVTAGASGAGSGVVSYSVAPNPSSVFRIGGLGIGGQTFWVGQAPALTTRRVAGDFDLDGRRELGVYRPSTGHWYLLQSSTEYTVSLTRQWGISTDLPVPGDYDGDGRTDIAVYRPSTGYWYVLQSSTDYTISMTLRWGISTDVPVPADYDGDGRTDIAVFRPSTGYWYVLQSSTGYTISLTLRWGIGTDAPVPGDYDGDGRADIAIFRPSTGYWYVLQSSTSYTISRTLQWGVGTDLPVPGDYDGDGRTDIAVYRPSTGYWYVLQSSTAYTISLTVQWGISTDLPVPGDYDGDGRTDIAVYRPSTGVWYVLQSWTQFTLSAIHRWGLPGDVPVG